MRLSASARSAAIRGRRRPQSDGPPLRLRDLPAAAGARPRLQPDDRRDRRFPRRGRACLREHAQGRRADRHHEGARLPLLAAAGYEDGGRRPGAAGGQEGAQRPPARAFARGLPAALARKDRSRGRRARRVPADDLRRRRRRTDRLPSALAHPRRGDPRDAAMSLIGRIEEELTAAMKERDTARRDALRLILNALRSAERELQRPLHDEEELQVLQRERKRRHEAIEAYQAAGRDEQAAIEERELTVLEEFMPEPLGEDELERIVDDAIAENGATSLRDLGRVMADVMPQVAGRADGSYVSQLVREKLA